MLAGQTNAGTETSAESAAAVVSHPSFDRARFIPGTVLAKRYRIIGLLGRGGMGEVYRADDLKLGQAVALKFLPLAVERDSGRLGRFLNEVKVALRVTHPNVCRVYDIGEADGHHFLSMEYVDGEDLASLLKRIGRLPREKATQIARQLCAGLAAAHDDGIVHRDLKPANVMIDGRGRAKVTDFGLASWAASVEAGDVRSGTPLYMAPEQLVGHEVTIRSDIYSLGLVLYELFTGKRAFEAVSPAELLRLEQESSPKSPSSHVEGLDPAVERAILRCLAREPEDRPSSALAVAAALPGGDPLAAALAAGETPSPEMVAAAGPRGGLRPRVALACLALVFAGILAKAWHQEKSFLLPLVHFEKSFEALQDDAREIARKLGYSEPPADSFAVFSADLGRFMHLSRGRGPAELRRALARPGEFAVSFFYRQSPLPLVRSALSGDVGFEDPPSVPGDVQVALDLRGRLFYFRAVPPRAEFSAEPPPAPDWRALFVAAGLEIEAFTPTAPTIQPRVFADSRMAWSGVLAHLDDEPVRIEAAAFRGRPVYFELVIPSDPHWSEQTKDMGKQLERSFRPLQFSLMGLLAAVVCGTVLLAVRNIRLGRGDRKGATRLGIFVFGLQMTYCLLTEHHVPDLIGEVSLMVLDLCGALMLGVLVAVLYLALEPYVRRLWPEAIVSWTRLLSGQFRDPVVGRDVLAGMATMSALMLLGWPILWVQLLFPGVNAPGFLRGGRYAVGDSLGGALVLLTNALIVLMSLLLLRIVLRRPWIAGVVFCILWSGLAIVQLVTLLQSVPTVLVMSLWSLLFGVSLLVLLTRFGLVAAIAGFVATNTIYPFTTDVSAPYFGISLIPIAAVLVLALYGFKVSLGGQTLFRDDLLDVAAAPRR